jgi:hypothetical protein
MQFVARFWLKFSIDDGNFSYITNERKKGSLWLVATSQPKSDRKKNLWRNGAKTSCYRGWASTGESEIGTNLPEKEKADHDPSFCFHFFKFRSAGEYPKETPS